MTSFAAAGESRPHTRITFFSCKVHWWRKHSHTPVHCSPSLCKGIVRSASREQGKNQPWPYPPTSEVVQILLVLVQGVSEIWSLCSQLVLGWWDHLHTLRVVLYIPPHLLHPLARPLPLGSRCCWWSVSNLKLTAPEVFAENQGKPLLSSTAPDFFQICLPLTRFLSKTHLPKPSRQQIYGCTCPSCCVKLQLPNAVPLTVAVQAKEGLGGQSSSCSSPEVALKQFFIF